MSKQHTEVERKYDVATGDGLSEGSDAGRTPDLDLSHLTSVDGVRRVSRRRRTELDATYVDTATLDLMRHRVTLRRRVGGADEGWHLKLFAAGDTHVEYRAPLGRSARQVPKELARQVRALTRGRPLQPVARLHTDRTERHLRAADGTDLAVVTEDTVQAEHYLNGTVQVSTWREVEVELVDGDQDVLAYLDKVFVQHIGLRPSPWPSKLGRALGPAGPEPTATDAASPDDRKTTVGDALSAHLGAQVHELLARDRQARADEPDGVHKMRVATRRLRSALATYRPVLDRTVTDPVRDELKWVGQVLGKPRDAEVQLDRLAGLVDDQPAELVLGAVRRRIRFELQARHKTALADLRETLDSDRYFRLLDDLDALLADLPLTDRAHSPATRELPRLVRKSAKRVDKAAAAAAQATGNERDHALHELRKAAKRARYAAESARPALGRSAKRLAARMEAVQTDLGEHQDSVTARAVLRELAVAAHGAGENGFTYGRLHREEQARGATARASAARQLRRATRRRLRTALG